MPLLPNSFSWNDRKQKIPNHKWKEFSNGTPSVLLAAPAFIYNASPTARLAGGQPSECPRLGSQAPCAARGNGHGFLAVGILKGSGEKSFAPDKERNKSPLKTTVLAVRPFLCPSCLVRLIFCSGPKPSLGYKKQTVREVEGAARGA